MLSAEYGQNILLDEILSIKTKWNPEKILTWQKRQKYSPQGHLRAPTSLSEFTYYLTEHAALRIDSAAPGLHNAQLGAERKLSMQQNLYAKKHKQIQGVYNSAS